MRPIHHRSAVTAVSALALVATACGDGSDGREDDAADDAAPTHTLELEARDFSFAPSALKAPSGARVTVTVRNTGAAPHTFTSADVDVDEQVPTGESSEVSFTMPESGSVSFVCTFHEARGMTGSIAPS